MRTVTIDFETEWDSKSYSLKGMSAEEYVTHPRFHAQLLGVRVDRGPVAVFEQRDIREVLTLLDLRDPDTVTVGHNILGFDALILEKVYGVTPANIKDTMLMGKELGLLPGKAGGSHAALTKALNNGVKRPGTVISDGKHWPDDFTPEEQEDFRKYCSEDVLQCSENYFSMVQMLAGRR